MQIADKVARDCEAARLDASAFVDRLARAFHDAIADAFQHATPTRVFLQLPAPETPFTSVRLGALVVMVPADERDRAVLRDALWITLYGEPGRTAELDVTPAAIVAHAADRTILCEVVASALPERGWWLAFLDLVHDTQSANPGERTP